MSWFALEYLKYSNFLAQLASLNKLYGKFIDGAFSNEWIVLLNSKS